jgi:hypothetical protein
LILLHAKPEKLAIGPRCENPCAESFNSQIASFDTSNRLYKKYNSKKMETKTLEIPLIQKSKVEKKQNPVAASSCCAPKKDAVVCCTPSESKEENNGPCCAQPDDGSACCDK